MKGIVSFGFKVVAFAALALIVTGVIIGNGFQSEQQATRQLQAQALIAQSSAAQVEAQAEANTEIQLAQEVTQRLQDEHAAEMNLRLFRLVGSQVKFNQELTRTAFETALFGETEEQRVARQAGKSFWIASAFLVITFTFWTIFAHPEFTKQLIFDKVRVGSNWPMVVDVTPIQGHEVAFKQTQKPARYRSVPCHEYGLLECYAAHCL